MKRNKKPFKKWKNLPHWLKEIIVGGVMGFIVSFSIVYTYLRVDGAVIYHFSSDLDYFLGVILGLYSFEESIVTILKFIIGTSLLFSFIFLLLSEIILLIKKYFTRRFFKWTSTVVIFLLIIFVVYFILWDMKWARVQINESDFCYMDSDCIKVSAGCCGCTAGGNSMAINKYNYTAPNCTGVMCLAVMSNHWTCFAKPICENNYCALKESFNNHIVRYI